MKTRKRHADTAQSTANSTPEPEKRDLRWLFLVGCVFVLRVVSWMSSELWYDEVLTLKRFIAPYLDHPAEIFRDYPIANNHMLATYIHALWMNLCGGVISEPILRLPDLVFGLAAIAIVMLHWRKALGNACAGLAGLTLAISPVFAAYAYQMRGYSLTMLLGVLALSGALEVIRGSRTKGQALLFLSAGLLPLCMPSNLMLAPAMAVFVFLGLKTTGKTWRGSFVGALPWCIGTLLGGAYYLTIWRQFKQAMAEPNGWNSAWAVAGNVALAFALHGLILLLVIAWKARRRECRGALAQHAWVMLGTLGTIVASALLVFLAAQDGHAPFPRVFLVFLPMITFLMAFAAEKCAICQKRLPFLCTAILFVGIVTERLAQGVTDLEMKHGQVPDNLLQQYYRGSEDLRTTAENLHQRNINGVVLTNAYDWMTLSFYAQLYEPNKGQAPDDDVLVHLIVVDSAALNGLHPETAEVFAKRKLYVLANDKHAAQELLRALPPQFKRGGVLSPAMVLPSGRRTIFE